MSKGGVGVNEILQLFLKVAGEVMFGFMYIFEVESENSTYEEKHWHLESLDNIYFLQICEQMSNFPDIE